MCNCNNLKVALTKTQWRYVYHKQHSLLCSYHYKIYLSQTETDNNVTWIEPKKAISNGIYKRSLLLHTTEVMSLCLMG